MERRIRVKICTGTTCHLMGGHLLFDLAERLPAWGRERVDVEGAHCLGLCGQSGVGSAPFAMVDGDLVASATPEILESEILRRLRAEKQP